MNDYQILSAVRENGGSITFKELMDMGLSDKKHNPVEDSYRIENLLSGGFLSGSIAPYGRIRMERKGTALLDLLEQKLQELENQRADKIAEQEKQRQFSVKLAILSEVISFLLGFLLRALLG